MIYQFDSRHKPVSVLTSFQLFRPQTCEDTRKETALRLMNITKGITTLGRRALGCGLSHKPTSYKALVSSCFNIIIQLHNASLLPFYNREIVRRKFMEL